MAILLVRIILVTYHATKAALLFYESTGNISGVSVNDIDYAIGRLRDD